MHEPKMKQKCIWFSAWPFSNRDKLSLSRVRFLRHEEGHRYAALTVTSNQCKLVHCLAKLRNTEVSEGCIWPKEYKMCYKASTWWCTKVAELWLKHWECRPASDWWGAAWDIPRSSMINQAGERSGADSRRVFYITVFLKRMLFYRLIVMSSRI